MYEDRFCGKFEDIIFIDIHPCGIGGRIKQACDTKNRMSTEHIVEDM